MFWQPNTNFHTLFILSKNPVNNLLTGIKQVLNKNAEAQISLKRSQALVKGNIKNSAVTAKK